MHCNICDEMSDNGFSLSWLAKQYPELSALKQIPQNPEYHGEGDVYQHTEMVCQRLTESALWQFLPCLLNTNQSPRDRG